MAIQIINNLKIQTINTFPPIPVRSFDWQAWLDDEEPENWDRVGQGATEQEAISDLMEKLSEQEA